MTFTRKCALVWAVVVLVSSALGPAYVGLVLALVVGLALAVYWRAFSRMEDWLRSAFFTPRRVASRRHYRWRRGGGGWLTAFDAARERPRRHLREMRDDARRDAVVAVTVSSAAAEPESRAAVIPATVVADGANVIDGANVTDGVNVDRQDSSLPLAKVIEYQQDSTTDASQVEQPHGKAA
ncbi:MAG: hypothetical protein DWQ42_20345 [Planctomycetota bacterium]|nr:MAG: hypothetical protein DWQ42_20345 [Planctomycetota bacterium]REK40460.1 MAG: hypothetical protein DWQ46_16355 [Planctomycetota bacterium]